MDSNSRSFEKTLTHVKQIYPTCTLQAQINIRKALMDESGNNAGLMLYSQNKRIEKQRQEGPHFKSFLVSKEKQKT